MAMLQAVLRYATPIEWEEATYNSKRYHLFDLRPGDDEYATEVNPFINGQPRIEVKSLQRVQNPYQLGRFVIRKEQKQFRNETVEVVKYYHPIKKADLDIALEHNMDVRRYTSRDSGHHDGDRKNPKFYRTPGSAYTAISSANDLLILICNVLGRNYEEHSTYKTNDTEYMPVPKPRLRKNCCSP